MWHKVSLVNERLCSGRNVLWMVLGMKVRNRFIFLFIIGVIIRTSVIIAIAPALFVLTMAKILLCGAPQGWLSVNSPLLFTGLFFSFQPAAGPDVAGSCLLTFCTEQPLLHPVSAHMPVKHRRLKIALILLSGPPKPKPVHSTGMLIRAASIMCSSLLPKAFHQVFRFYRGIVKWIAKGESKTALYVKKPTAAFLPAAIAFVNINGSAVIRNYKTAAA